MTNYYVSSVAYAAVSTWQALTGGVATAISAGQYVRNTTPHAADSTETYKRLWKCTTPGTTSTTEPAAWSTTTPGNDGATVTDGTVVWTEVMGREAEQAAGNWHAPGSDLRAQAVAKPPTAGDTVFISSDHAETFTASYATPANLRNSNMLCVSRVGANLPPIAGDLTTGAVVGITGSNQTLQVQWGFWYGVTFQGQDTSANQNNILFNGTINMSTAKTVLENCLLEVKSTNTNNNISIGSGALGSVLVEWINTSVKCASAVGGFISLTNFGYLIWRDTPSNGVQGTSPGTLFTFTGGNGGSGFGIVRGVDLSGFSSGSGKLFSVGSLNSSGKLTIKDCKLSPNITDANMISNNAGPGDEDICISIDNCGDVTGAQNWRMFRGYYTGIVKAVNNPYRAASDGVTGISWAYSSLNDSRLTNSPYWYHLTSPEIATRYNTTGSSKTLTVEMLYNGSAILTNAQAWIDAEVLTTSGVPLASNFSSKPATVLTAASSLTASTAAWTATARANTHAYSVGDAISSPNNVGRVFFCTTAGTSAGSEPAGYASAVDGGSVTDGTAVFRAGWRMNASVAFTPQVQGVVLAKVKFAVQNAPFHFFVDPFLSIV